MEQDTLRLDPLSARMTATRALLRVDSPAAAARVLADLARDLGADVAGAGPGDPLPFDLNLGRGEPVYAWAAPGSPARTMLEEHLPAVHEDASLAATLAEGRSRAARGVLDPTTGLYTEESIVRIVRRLWAGDTVVCAALDLDGLVERDGTAAAHQAVHAFAWTVQDETRLEDHVGLLEHAGVILPLRYGSVAGAEAFLTRVRRLWHSRPGPTVTFSAGIAPVTSSGGLTALDAAREALDGARKGGGDRWRRAPVSEPSWSPTASAAPVTRRFPS